jgi:hypothetical protein
MIGFLMKNEFENGRKRGIFQSRYYSDGCLERVMKTTSSD